MRKILWLAPVCLASLALSGCFYSWSPLSDYSGQWHDLAEAKTLCKADTAPSGKFYRCMKKLGWGYMSAAPIAR